ncbi:hypothetical protein EYF80_025986 [Liparis tanakae]|uniref:Uncharacterized protein n=1 Tax=Liparis tanakae TaxID=230148 RepID=A0A4Z2HFT7_9TELE|nr:hypothetical protein EYF80_025986 [Liparis tanakae]
MEEVGTILLLASWSVSNQGFWIQVYLQRLRGSTVLQYNREHLEREERNNAFMCCVVSLERRSVSTSSNPAISRLCSSFFKLPCSVWSSLQGEQKKMKDMMKKKMMKKIEREKEKMMKKKMMKNKIKKMKKIKKKKNQHQFSLLSFLGRSSGERQKLWNGSQQIWQNII